MAPSKDEGKGETIDSLIELATYIEESDKRQCQAEEQMQLKRQEQQLKEMEEQTKAYIEAMAEVADDQEAWSPPALSDYRGQCKVIDAQGGFAEDQGYVSEEVLLWEQIREEEED
ncbi:hypothetical protein DXG01_011189 [Tephrocybe rancida]|nr:hypothetical protein DXG01_011189 [Tephrocybe rancida]